MSSKTQHSMKYIGAKIWNNIPSDLKNAPYSKFKESYKKFLLSVSLLSVSLQEL